MTIGIDYRFAVRSVRGIGHYIRQIVAQLVLLDQQNQYILYTDEEVCTPFPQNFQVSKLAVKNLIIFEQYYLPRQARRDKVDVLWYPSNSGPILLHKNILLIVTIHDLAFNKKIKYFRNLNSFKKAKFAIAEVYRSLSLKYGLKRISKIITVSEYSALQIKNKLKRKAVVIYNQMERLQENQLDETVLQRLSVTPKNYVYTMTGDAPHKNLDGYLRLFNDFAIDMPLVISGVPDSAIVSMPYAANIVFSGTVTEAEKSSLYKHAAGFLFLSYEEGFGLPILEAMQFELPIVCSNRGALPEVGGNGVTLVNPDDLRQVATVLNQTIRSGYVPLAAQKMQLGKFSNWANSAKQHMEIFSKKIETP